MDLNHTPLSPPPHFHSSNFVDPPTLSTTLIAISTACLSLTVPFTAMRLYTKACIVRSVGWDDGEFATLIEITADKSQEAVCLL